jgi:mono/diheme cytochrome c family protein
LTPSNGKELEYVVENLDMDKTTSNIIVFNHLDVASTLDIRTVSKYPDVFQKNCQVCHRIVKLSLLLN